MAAFPPTEAWTLDLRFDNRFVTELPGEAVNSPRPRQVTGVCWSPITPTPVRQPALLAYSEEMASMLGLTEQTLLSQEFVEVFAGNRLAQGMQPYAACYGGHQFGNWAGQLGDGRAISLGEAIDSQGQRWELQLKGAGMTPYSRHADGRAVLRSSVREFLCSEAMHHLGVPTTRALSLVGTGEPVLRDMMYDGNPRHEPGAIVCRVAPSFLRFGNYEILAFREDLANLEKLVDFTISRDFPHLQGEVSRKRADWFTEVCERTAVMVAHWMRVGFVHAVMNTDNMSVLGLTIDYGPYGWMDNYDPDWTPNTTDAGRRRYRFGAQPAISHWNLIRLANALYDVFPGPEPLEAGLERFVSVYNQASLAHTAAKFGLAAPDHLDIELTQEIYRLMSKSEVDMTLFYRGLACIDPDNPETEPLHDAFYSEKSREAHKAELSSWLQRYTDLLRFHGEPWEQRRARMDAVNPLYVLRNYLAQEAIDQAQAGDTSLISELLDTLRRPYQEQPGRARFAQKRPDWARHRPGCSMLSCSS
jgi:uncharacterized protein YdiU (UPF0061 family)